MNPNFVSGSAKYMVHNMQEKGMLEKLFYFILLFFFIIVGLLPLNCNGQTTR